MYSQENIFDYSGFAQLSDLKTPEWANIFQNMEHEQSLFLLNEKEFRSSGYRWPRDPLHTWSRLWEYPYVYYHLEKIKKIVNSQGLLKVADIGSGVTFFPFFVSKLGFDVTCVDNDLICKKDLLEAIKLGETAPGKVSVILSENEYIPLDDESQDVVYCISVIEHILNFEKIISEISRILKPGGIFILTNDIDLKGNFELGVESFNRLQKVIRVHFNEYVSPKITHPSDLLTTINSPYGLSNNSPIYLFKKLLKHLIRKETYIPGLKADIYLTVYASIFKKI
jgi:SAM-dependent methyltransferase